MKEMRQDLDTLCAEIEKDLASRSFAIFRGHHRALENRPQVDWDVAKRAAGDALSERAGEARAWWRKVRASLGRRWHGATLHIDRHGRRSLWALC